MNIDYLMELLNDKDYKKVNQYTIQAQPKVVHQELRIDLTKRYEDNYDKIFRKKDKNEKRKSSNS